MLLVLLIHRNPGFDRYANGVTPFTILQPDTVTEETIAAGPFLALILLALSSHDPSTALAGGPSA